MSETSTEAIVLSIVCPCYNEEQMALLFLESIYQVLMPLNETFEIIFVNDGSSDATLARLISAKHQYPHIRILNLSRNFGKESALTAGLEHARGQAIIPIDVDLQDPPALISEMLTKWREGYDVVLAKRIDRSSDTFIKKITATWFYKFHNYIAQVSIPDNVGDYRLISRKVLDAVNKMPENQRFMKGVFAWVGFNTTVIEYVRDSRKAGESCFNGWRLWNLALEGITSFSTVPLRIWLYIGAFVSSLAFLYGSFIVLKTLILGVDLPGYASLLTAVLFLGGIQMMGIGVLGEYIGRIYLESKRRPTYIIEREY